MIRSKILPWVAILLVIGLIFISLSSLNEAITMSGDKYFFIKKQLQWVVIGIAAMLSGLLIKLSWLKKISLYLYLGSCVLLLLLFIPGVSQETLGAKRWIEVGGFTVQPSELFKLAIVIFLARLFSQLEKRKLKFLLIYLSLPFGLIVLEPNLSTAILICLIGISIYYLSGGDYSSLFGLSLLLCLLSLVLILVSPYRMARFKSLIDPAAAQSSAASYHSRQIVLALASGGMWGKGFANSDQKYSYVPKLVTDSILAIMGEEVGFAGMVVLIYVYLLLVASLFKIANKIKDEFESVVLYGIASWIAFQTLINMAAIVSLIPLTGVPLPFISYGGSSLVVLMAAIGLAMNIERKNWTLLYSDSVNKEIIQKDNHHRNPSNSGD